MATFKEYPNYDGLGLAELVRKKEVSPAELLEEAISRTEKLNPRLNAVVNKLYDRARQKVQAGLPEGPFTGVPFLLKDLGSGLEGVPTSMSNRWMKDIPMKFTSELVRRYEQAGLVIFGKTNTPELGLTPYTEPELFGPAHNPWNLDRITGGSSGGSAAAVAAGLAPMAHGGDGGGSIRIPASCCGLFGFKPSRGRIPTGPAFGEMWQGFAIEHVLTRSVRDSAAILDATGGEDVGAPYAAPPQARPFLHEVAESPGKLKIAFTSQPFLGSKVDPECLSGLEKTVKLLESLGHTLVEAAPKVDKAFFNKNFVRMLAGELWADILYICELTGHRPSPAGFETSTYALGLLGKAVAAGEYVEALRNLQIHVRTIAAFFLEYDVLLTPTLASPPLPVGALQPSPSQLNLLKIAGALNSGFVPKASGMMDILADTLFDFIPYTPVFNATGQPAMSVPLHWSADGLPVGMQFIGRFGEDATLFRLAGQLEQAQPWFGKTPPVMHEG